jgi:putative transferase (TIGR04331 family)
MVRTSLSSPEPLEGQESERVEWELQYFRTHFDGLLADLGGALNEVLGQQKSIAFWRILVGPWLHHFVLFVLAQLRPNSMVATTLPRRRVAASGEDFAASTMTENYAQLVAADAAQSPVSQSAGQRDDRLATTRAPKWQRRLKAVMKAIHWCAQGILLHKAMVIVREGYFPQSTEINIWWLSRGRIRFDRRDYGLDPDALIVDQRRRTALAARLQHATTEPGATIRRLIPLHLPRIYLEGFDSLGRYADRMFREPAAAYFTCNAHWYDEVFKHQVARSRESGARLLIGQHGGNHGIVETLLPEEFERGIADRFCTWGWREDDRTIPMPAPKLMGLFWRRRAGTEAEILFTATAAVTVDSGVDPSHPYAKSRSKDYLAWQIRFLTALSPPLRCGLRFRTLWDWAGDFWKPLLKAFPEVLIENAYECGVPFRERLAACRLYVCDHLSTTYAEALAANKPTLLFWDPEITRVRSAAQPFIDALHACGILHFNPESAAREVSKAYADVHAWWSDPGKQKAVQDFRDRYLLTDKNSSKSWAKFLIGEAGSNVGESKA